MRRVQFSIASILWLTLAVAISITSLLDVPLLVLAYPPGATLLLLFAALQSRMDRHTLDVGSNQAFRGMMIVTIVAWITFVVALQWSGSSLNRLRNSKPASNWGLLSR